MYHLDDWWHRRYLGARRLSMLRAHDSTVSRRSFLKWTLASAGALAALPLLEACSSRSSQQAAAPPAATSVPPAATSAAAPAAAAPTAGPTAGTRTGISTNELNHVTIRAQTGTLHADHSIDMTT